MAELRDQATPLEAEFAIKDTPPPGWADDLYSDEYKAPDDGWPPSG